MEFENQVKNVKVTIDTRPRVFLNWENTEEGRDKKDCYERVDLGGTIVYVNTYNRNSSVLPGEPFFYKLESMYESASKSI